jgi:hypothetical protein
MIPSTWCPLLTYFALKNPGWAMGDGRQPEREDGLDLLG